jgi:CubicO group peptidase (beta-lactamase class C family)
MKLVRMLLVVALVLAFGRALAQEPTAVTKPEQLGMSGARLQKLVDVYQGYVDSGKLPGAVLLVARGDRVALFQAVGFQNREKQTLMKTDAIFRLASMTKPIVSVAAMTLVEDGKLNLLAPVSTYLPEMADVQVGVEKLDQSTARRSWRWSRRSG